MINQDILIKYIEMKLGVPFQVLELSNAEILNIITTFTLPEFSVYYPKYEIIEVDSEKDECEKGSYTYFLKTKSNIIGVSKFLPYTTSVIANQGVAVGTYETAISSSLSCSGEGMWGYGSGLALDKIYRDNMSYSRLPETFEFIPPNKVEIYPKHIGSYGKFLIECKVVHPNHLMTIPEGLKSFFLDMAFYDVCIALYPIRKRFETIGTAYGDLQLFMQYLEEANDKKNDLLDKFKSNFYKSPRKKKVFIY